jgi:hypothetical protein
VVFLRQGLIMKPRLAFQSSCHRFPRAETVDSCHHAWLHVLVFFFCFVFLQYWGLNSESHAKQMVYYSHSPSPLAFSDFFLVVLCFQIVSSFCPGWSQTAILLPFCLLSSWDYTYVLLCLVSFFRVLLTFLPASRRPWSFFV